jgi:LmbE family N-acetylglucosaminyl deacetylase
VQSISILESGRGPKRILALGAHSDDIEIGAGGTLLRLIKDHPETEVCWVVLAAAGPRKAEALESASVFLAGTSRKQIILKEFRDGYFPYDGKDIKDFFEELKQHVAPDLILTHYRDDRHQDHRVVSDLTSNTFRDHLILEYEILKYDGDLGRPNVFVALDESHVRQKIATIIECFRSQRNRTWFTADTFTSILRVRGVECNAAGGYAEAFYGRKLVY